MTEQQLDRAFQMAAIVGDTIQALQRVPSGELYARVMGHMDLVTYNGIIGTLKSIELVSEKNHELIWIGPPKEEHR